MLRQSKNKLKPNKFDLVAPATREYWQKFDIAGLHAMLENSIINIDCTSSLPRHENIIQLLQIVNGRVKKMGNAEMMRCCLEFILDSETHLNSSHDTAQKYMQTRAMASFHLDHFQDATIYAGILGDKYFLLHRAETDKEAMHYNKIAGFAYEQCGKVLEACHHYNHFIYSTIMNVCDDDEFLYALNYLVKHKALIITWDISRSLFERLESQEDELTFELEILLLEASTFEAGADSATYYDYVQPTTEFGMIMATDALLVSSSNVASWMNLFRVIDKNLSGEDNHNIQSYLSSYENAKKANSK